MKKLIQLKHSSILSMGKVGIPQGDFFQCDRCWDWQNEKIFFLVLWVFFSFLIMADMKLSVSAKRRAVTEGGMAKNNLSVTNSCQKERHPPKDGPLTIFSPHV